MIVNKQAYLNGDKVYNPQAQSRGCKYVNKIVKVDWKLAGPDALEELTKNPGIAAYIAENDTFIVTDEMIGGLESFVVLDELIAITPFYVYDAKTNEYLFWDEAINGDGYYHEEESKGGDGANG